MINEKENAVLLIAGFTQREISDRKRKFYNLFRIEPWLVPMRKHGEWGGLTTQEILDIVDDHTETPNAIPMLYLATWAKDPAMRQRGLRGDVAGYFCLPKSVQDTGLRLWEDFDDAWQDHALACAEEVVTRLREGRFWPPAEHAFEQGYEELFLGDVLAAVDPL